MTDSATVPRVRAGGSSESWNRGKSRAVALFDQWAKSVGKPTLSEMSESQLTAIETYELFIGWLVYTYESQGRTNRLQLGTVKNFFGTVLQAAARRAREAKWTSNDTIAFFTCVDVRNRTESAV